MSNLYILNEIISYPLDHNFLNPFVILDILSNSTMFCLVIIPLGVALILLATQSEGINKMGLDFLVDKLEIKKDPLPIINLVFISHVNATGARRLFFYDKMDPTALKIRGMHGLAYPVPDFVTIGGVLYSGFSTHTNMSIPGTDRSVRKFRLDSQAYHAFRASHDIKSNDLPLHVDADFYAHVHQDVS